MREGSEREADDTATERRVEQQSGHCLCQEAGQLSDMVTEGEKDGAGKGDAAKRYGKLKILFKLNICKQLQHFFEC